MNRPLPYIIGAGVLYWLLKNQTAKVSAYPTGGELVRRDFDGIVVSVDIKLENDTLVPLPVEGFEGQIIRSGVKLADAAMIGDAITVPRGGEAIIKVGAKILYSGIVSEILTGITEGRISNSVTMKGVLYAAGRKIPVNFNYELW
jgi:LEA14-like dessication related protein